VLHRRSVLTWAGLAVAALPAACSHSWYGASDMNWNERGRGAYDVPIRFTVDSSKILPGAIGCPAMMYDPRDHHGIRLTQSGKDDAGHSRGDYEVAPPGRYGVRPGELLRVDCQNGRAVGIVPEPQPD